MTEEEAKGKWCPLARVKFSAETDENKFTVITGNRTSAGGIAPKVMCIGSGCMAWRIKEPKYLGEDEDGAGIYDGDLPTGYCGAFGEP